MPPLLEEILGSPLKTLLKPISKACNEEESYLFPRSKKKKQK
jgi:hypothetical protein